MGKSVFEGFRTMSYVKLQCSILKIDFLGKLEAVRIIRVWFYGVCWLTAEKPRTFTCELIDALKKIIMLVADSILDFLFY